MYASNIFGRMQGEKKNLKENYIEITE